MKQQIEDKETMLNIKKSPLNQTTTPPFELFYSPQFSDWLKKQDVSVAFISYRMGKTFLIGRQPNRHGRLSIYESTFNRCIGFYANSETLYISFLCQLWRFENMLSAQQQY